MTKQKAIGLQLVLSAMTRYHTLISIVQGEYPDQLFAVPFNAPPVHPSDHAPNNQTCKPQNSQASSLQLHGCASSGRGRRSSACSTALSSCCTRCSTGCSGARRSAVGGGVSCGSDYSAMDVAFRRSGLCVLGGFKVGFKGVAVRFPSRGGDVNSGQGAVER